MKDLISLFWAFCKIGGLTFGGGYAMLPMLQKEVVEENQPFVPDFPYVTIKLSDEKEILALNGETTSDYPMPFTPRVGVAGNLFDVKNFSGGMSVDFSFPTFQNVVFNAGLEFNIANIIRISTGWKADLREILAEQASLIPTAGISVKFNFSSKEDSFLAKKGWQKSEML